MKVMNNGKNKNLYLLFDCFWLIVLLPKPVQLFVLLGFSVYLLNFKTIISKDKFCIIQYCVLLIYGVSILFNILITSHETARIFAAANTFLITFTALSLYQIYSKSQIDSKRVGKSFLFNTAILFCILLLYLFYPGKDNLTIMGHSISAIDFFEGFSTRFVGFFAYANLVPLFSIISIPFVVDYFENRKIYSLVILVMNFIFSFFANSRSGQLAMLLIMALFAYDYFKLKVKKSIIKWYVLITMIIIVTFGLITFPYISDKIDSVFLARTESNSMRFTIYEKSLEKMIEYNPVIGMGIKDLYGGSIYPYGSHSSYIGYFYKTGIFGGCLYLLSIILYLYKIAKWKKRTMPDNVYFISAIALFVWMVLEDLDGTNWSICYAYIMLGIICSRIKNGFNGRYKCSNT